MEMVEVEPEGSAGPDYERKSCVDFILKMVRTERPDDSWEGHSGTSVEKVSGGLMT